MLRDALFHARCVCLYGLFLLPSYGTLINYTDRPAFNDTVSGLPTETFAAALVNPASVTSCNGPLSNATSNACFPVGGLLPGIAFSSTSGSMVVIGAEYSGIGNPGKVLGPNLFADSLDLTFMRANTVGFDLYAGINPGSALVSVYNPANTLLGAFAVSAPFGGGFFGVVSDTELIGRININSQANPSGELIGNLSFGVPEPSSLVLLGIGLIGLVFWRWQKRSIRN